MSDASTVVDVSAWAGVIGGMIGSGTFLITLAMLKNCVSKGLSVVLAEFLINNASDEMILKVARMFGNKELILAELKEIKKNMTEVTNG